MGYQVTTGKILADTFATARQLTRYYLSKLKEADPHVRHSFSGIELNSTYWLVAHLIWAEDYLMLRALGHPGTGIEWLDQFKVGSNPDAATLDLPFKELLDLQQEVHHTTLAHLASMTEDQFAEENALGIRFGDETGKRYLAMHGIRHEATHTGHLGIIAKIEGGRTI